jgi:4,5-dihydroxyphthalate decarboxylase
LPTLVMGRYQHPYLLYNAERGELKPRDLEGKRVAMRAWTVTTVTWIRGLLANDYGVDLEKIQWFTQEDAHVPGFKDPEGVTRLPADIDITELLLNGDVEAAVIPGPNPDPRLKPIFGDPDAEAAAWASKHDALHVNHYVAVKTALAKAEPEIVAEVTRMLTESKQIAGLPKPGTPDTNLIGIEDNRRSLEIMIDNCYQQGLIPERYSVDSLFDPNT